MTSKELSEILNKTRRTPNISLTPEQVEELVKDLEGKEKQDKILNYLKNNGILGNNGLYYYIYIPMIKESKDLLKEWLENDK